MTHRAVWLGFRIAIVAGIVLAAVGCQCEPLARENALLRQDNDLLRYRIIRLQIEREWLDGKRTW